MTFILQLSHRFFVLVATCLALITVYGMFFAGVGGRVSNWEGDEVLPGSIGVMRVACPWVHCRVPPGLAYLVRQGQEVFVEEDGCNRHPIVLVVIPRSQSQK